MIHIENLNITINALQPIPAYVPQTPEPDIEQQLRDMLQALDMVHSTAWDGITPQEVTPVTGEAKDQAIEEIFQRLRVHYWLAERGIRQHSFE
jgi:hypothetical protein